VVDSLPVQTQERPLHAGRGKGQDVERGDCGPLGSGPGGDQDAGS